MMGCSLPELSVMVEGSVVVGLDVSGVAGSVLGSWKVTLVRIMPEKA